MSLSFKSSVVCPFLSKNTQYRRTSKRADTKKCLHVLCSSANRTVVVGKNVSSSGGGRTTSRSTTTSSSSAVWVRQTTKIFRRLGGEKGDTLRRFSTARSHEHDKQRGDEESPTKQSSHRMAPRYYKTAWFDPASPCKNFSPLLLREGVPSHSRCAKIKTTDDTDAMTQHDV